jgi:putative GTP pyrophosphokinase
MKGADARRGGLLRERFLQWAAPPRSLLMVLRLADRRDTIRDIWRQFDLPHSEGWGSEMAKSATLNSPKATAITFASEFAKAFESRKPILRAARRTLLSILRRVTGAIEDKSLVRVRISRIRIKNPASLERKARRKGWNVDDAIFDCGDLIGGRVVCNNVEDAYRFAELLREGLQWHAKRFHIQDQIKSPSSSGYRALHINFVLGAGKYPLNGDLIPCEIQIRTRLQDAWAELSHDDLYKQGELPKDLRARARDLADLLATADKIAGDIRLRVMQEVVPPKQQPDLTRVSTAGIAFTFKDAFGRSPSDYMVRHAVNLCEELNLTSLKSLQGVLRRREFRKRLVSAYSKIVRWPPANEDIFLASLHAAATDDRSAIKCFRQQARREREEIEQAARQEMLSSLPGTIDEFIEAMENTHDEPEIESWAKALGATTECAVCGNTVIQPDLFAQEATQHYEVPEEDAAEIFERIERAVNNSGADIGGPSNSNLCGYHAYQMSKDD